MEIIVAIDIIEGKCVRLSQGDYSRKKVYNENPLEVAKQFENAGIKRLHLVDLDGARKGVITNQKILELIASKTNLVIDFGGGIKTDADIESVYNAGAQIATIGSTAVKNPNLFLSWVEKYGPEKILLGVDVSPVPKPGNKNEKYFLVINGWTMKRKISVFDFIKRNVKQGVTNIFCTDISKDGMMKGPSVNLYKQIVKTCLTPFGKGRLIASGGISSLKDIETLRHAGCKGVIIGKAIYEGNIRLPELKFLF